MNKRGETHTPCILKHCGAITGALNIPARHDAAHGVARLQGLLLRGPFCPIMSVISLQSSKVQATGSSWLGNSLLNTRNLPLREYCGSGLHTDQSRCSSGNAGISIHYNEAVPFWLQWSVWVHGGRKKARKVETNSIIFAETLQLSGEGDLLAIA